MQQFIIVNVDKGEYLDPPVLGDGRRLREFGGVVGAVLAALAWMLADRNDGDVIEHPLVGRWCGDRIVVAGEKAPGDVHLPDKWLTTWRSKQPQGSEFGDKPNLYTYAQACGLDMSQAAAHMLTQEPGFTAQALHVGRALAATSSAPLSAELREALYGDAEPSGADPEDTSMFDVPEDE
jgi:hypothetical protein